MSLTKACTYNVRTYVRTYVCTHTRMHEHTHIRKKITGNSKSIIGPLGFTGSVSLELTEHFVLEGRDAIDLFHSRQFQQLKSVTSGCLCNLSVQYSI